MTTIETTVEEEWLDNLITNFPPEQRAKLQIMAQEQGLSEKDMSRLIIENSYRELIETAH